MQTREINIANIKIGAGNPLAFIAGPCVIENEASTLKAAEKIRDFSEKHKIPVIFKSSYDKANRSSLSSFRGPGIKEGLKVLKKVKDETGLPVLSDIHSAEQAVQAAEVLDVLQIPAFLCRQTDVVLAAATTGKPVNIKKGQFLSPWDVKNIVEKFTSAGNHNLTITERGVSFGYNNLVVDMRAFPVMRGFGYPVVYDATHSLQLPGGLGSSSGGQREYVPALARAAVAAACDAVFVEVHEDPDKALCDGPNMLSIDSFFELAERLVELNRLVKMWESS